MLLQHERTDLTPDQLTSFEHLFRLAFDIRKARSVVNRLMTIVIKNEMKILAVSADKTIGIIQPPPFINRLSHENSTVWPGFESIVAHPERERAAMLGIGIVQQSHRIASHTI